MAPKLFKEVYHYPPAQPDLSQKGRPNFWENWLMLLSVLRGATCVILYHTDVYTSWVFFVFQGRQNWVQCIMACVNSSSHLQLQELNLQLHLENAALQIQDSDYSILCTAKKQLYICLPSAWSLYVTAKRHLKECSRILGEDYFQTV